MEFSRTFHLSHEFQTVPIGRASKRGPQPRTPAQENGWFESRVMSRDHAELILSLDQHVRLLSLASTFSERHTDNGHISDHLHP